MHFPVPQKLRDLGMDQLIGLEADELTQAMLKDSRAFQAVRGSVAEAHLENRLEEMYMKNEIIDYDVGQGDKDKDFVVHYDSDSKILECKNVEVYDLGTKDKKRRFIKFATGCGYIESTKVVKLYNQNKDDIEKLRDEESDRSKEDLPSLPTASNLPDLLQIMDNHNEEVVNSVHRALPNWLRLSGYPRYQFSAHLANYPSLEEKSANGYVDSFEGGVFGESLTVDFQRTRNSEDETEKRYYNKDEVDILGVCMFSRSVEWEEFLFTSDLPQHPEYSNKYHQGVTVGSGNWYSSLTSVL